MPKFRLNKLVRDKIVDHQLARGQKPSYRKLGRREHVKALVEKIAEETNELLAAPAEKLAEEIADVEQALDDLKAVCEIDSQTVSDLKAAKLEKNGGFKKGLFISTLELAENDTWATYYRSEPKRYKELT